MLRSKVFLEKNSLHFRHKLKRLNITHLFQCDSCITYSCDYSTCDSDHENDVKLQKCNNEKNTSHRQEICTCHETLSSSDSEGSCECQDNGRNRFPAQ